MSLIAHLRSVFGTLFTAAPALPPARPAWLVEAEKHIGLKENTSKTEHNPIILQWLKTLGAAWADDETAWCGTFVGWCMKKGSADALPINPFGARNWLKYGVTITIPAPGAILVFHRGDPKGWTGHVGFYVGEDDRNYHVLGGNQSNSVNITKIAKARLLGIRWPSDSPVIGSRVVAARAGSVSTNEA